MGEILIGISSWTEPTLIAGGKFYPPEANSSEARLKYYASQFPIVEVDSTYYGLPTETTSGLWVNRTPDKFTFDIKAFRLFTQHPTMPVVLRKDIRESLPKDLRDAKTFYYRDLPREVLNELWKRFESALLPLDSAGKLGVVLFQFPPWFFPGNEQREYIASCKEKLPQYQLAVEFRHSSWVSEKNIDRTVTFLKDNKLAYVCVDEPQGLKSSVETANKLKGQTLNARAETIFEKPAFRHLILSQRSLILVDRFFEWRHENKKAYPYYIHLKNHEPFALAGIWDNWENPTTGENMTTCSIITTQANPLLEKVHNTKKRMPVILNQASEKLWLKNSLRRTAIQSMLIPYNMSEMQAHTVPNLVNRLGCNTQTPEVFQKQAYLDLPEIE